MGDPDRGARRQRGRPPSARSPRASRHRGGHRISCRTDAADHPHGGGRPRSAQQPGRGQLLRRRRSSRVSRSPLGPRLAKRSAASTGHASRAPVPTAGSSAAMSSVSCWHRPHRRVRVTARRSRVRFARRPAPIRESVAAEGSEDVPVGPMRRAIARRLTESKTTVPHFYMTRRLPGRCSAGASTEAQPVGNGSSPSTTSSSRPPRRRSSLCLTRTPSGSTIPQAFHQR